jgi:hypothetical protein
MKGREPRLDPSNLAMEHDMSQDNQDQATDPTDDLLGPPALIAGEDKTRYMRLRAAIEAEISPKNVLEQIAVKDETDKIWEEQRLKRNGAALIDGAFREAMEFFLEPICGTFEHQSETTQNYLSGDAKTKKAILSRLAECGITMEVIQAKAMQLKGGDLQVIDRMIFNRENGRRLLRKERERRSDFQTDERAIPVLVTPRSNSN